MIELIKKEVKIIFQDEFILVLDKPCSVVVNISKTSAQNTIQNVIIDRFDFLQKYKGVDFETSEYKKLDITLQEYEEFLSRAGIVHRLDKETSGVLLVAKDPLSFKNLKHQFKQRTVQKEYLALVLGKLKDSKIEIDAPIKRNPKRPLKFAVVQDGKPALTLIDKIQEIKIMDNWYTLVRVFPKTGRTHQIRVHLSAINHPIANDNLYLNKINFQQSSQVFTRLMLHARAITFVHPKTEQVVNYISQLPLEFEISKYT